MADIELIDDSTESSKPSTSLSSLERTALIPAIAMARFEGNGEQKIATKLKVSRRQIRNIVNSDEYNAFLKDLQEQSLKHALTQFRTQLDKLAPLATEALKNNLKDGKIEAVKLWATLVGAIKQDEKAEQAQNIQIVLPQGLVSSDTVF